MAIRVEIRPGDGERVVAQTHREDPSGISWHLRVAAGARRVDARSRDRGQPQRVARLTRETGIQGLYRRRRRGCTVRDPLAEPYADLVDRDFVVDGPDELWCTDITEHSTLEGKVYCAAVLAAYSRRVVGWSIDNNMRAALVVDALGMAISRRGPEPYSAILHSDHGSQFTSWAFGRRLVEAGLVASMGSIGDCYDNSMMESFWGTMQLELLDSRAWKTRAELATAIFEWIECWYNRNGDIPASGCCRQRTTKQPTPSPTKITDPTPSVSGSRGQAHPAGHIWGTARREMTRTNGQSPGLFGQVSALSRRRCRSLPWSGLQASSSALHL